MRYTRSVLAAAVATTTVLASTPAAEAALPALSPTTTHTVQHGVTLLLERTPVTARPATGKGATRADFDGDNRDDVAVFSNSGLSVAYSSAAHRDVLRTEVPGGSTALGTSMEAGDFNGDRYDDLAVGDYNEPDLRAMGYAAGAVWIIPGGPGGLRIDRAQHFNQSTAGVPGTSAQSDFFGMSLAAGDITGDGRDELAIGIPLKDVNGRNDAGAVVVLKGTANGVSSGGTRWISQATAGVPGAAGSGDQFGWSLAIGGIDRNRHQELVISAVNERPDTDHLGSGTITQFWGGPSGVSMSKVTMIAGGQITKKINKSNLYLWQIGLDLAIGDVNGDGYGEVVSGVSGAQAGANGNIYGGAVLTIPGRSTGLSATGAIAVTQESTGVAGGTENDDRFGDSIAVGDVTGDGRADVLAGVPGENAGTGTVVLLRGSAAGLTGVGSRTISQSTAGVPGGAERGDRFGAAVALLNLNGSGGLDALVSSPAEEIPGDPRGYPTGTVTRFLGYPSGLGSATLTDGRFLGGVAGMYGQTLAS
ncbi:FG-GAP and VCBS repeat-containing protein [Actinoplanes xinjiangensis]|uniref:FG-GAP and VCBS repeat-containing protein n=1 Tax=Actinoplanes xinjiangensis TaxID=512350 RepID=UPI0034209DBE